MNEALRPVAPPAPPSSVEEAGARVERVLRATPGGVVALSGGTDSALVLALAARVWGPTHCIAVTSRSESLAPRELDDARAQARAADVEHVVLAGAEVDLEAFRRNAPDRCFHCKDSLYDAARAVATARGLAWVVDGTNADDVGDHRPGLAAAVRHDVRSPLLEAGLTKPWVRALSRALGLSSWDKPSEACLSSRFPYGTPITKEGLDRVRRAEDVLRAVGFRAVRVRVHDPVARVEVPVAELGALVAPGVRDRVVSGLKELGFTYVAIDLEGLRSGSMNEVLRPHAAPAAVDAAPGPS